MAGCCPGGPAIITVQGNASDPNGVESDMRSGETVECYMARAGNSSGLLDDATENVPDKIENNVVPITRSPTSASTNVQFKLTSNSTRTATSWTISEQIPGLTMTTEGLLSGTFAATALSKTWNVKVEASDPAGSIDIRGFTVAPTVGGEGDEIRLVSPLPGGIVNSKFGPRMHPIHKVNKPHTGIDMKMADRSVKDVVAAADGEIQMVGGSASSKTGYGLRIWVKHFTGGGKHLCTTTYNHLNKSYVTEGQKVMAGQKIGLEGTSGSSTGNHLHFEVKLPDGKFVDPEPLINGSLTVAGKTLANGDADPASLSTKNSTASMSEGEAKAKQSCEAFGPEYPKEVPAPTVGPVPPGDPFEQAWFFTMKSEVGSWWMTTPEFSPGDADLDAGLIETPLQRKKSGYVNTSGFPGGETKFGVAQKPNPNINVRTMGYAAAKALGYNNYWKISSSPCTNKAKKVGVMLFDMNYHHGCGNARRIYANAGITSSPEDSDAKAIEDCRVLNAARVAFIKNIGNPKYQNGWLRRSHEAFEYVMSLP